MVSYFTNWATTTSNAWTDGNLALVVWSIGAQLLPFAGLALVVGLLGLGALKLYTDNY